jgi:two-component system phosphate regulon sensor histidine kinase PhoR
VLGDRERLQQALVVVLDNAVRYSPPGGRVEVRLLPEEGGWCLRVEDEGPGMADDEIERAFEPNFRGRSASRLDASGTGLGLAIAQRILAAHEGSVGLEPRHPRGLRASLFLPAAGAEED